MTKLCIFRVCAIAASITVAVTTSVPVFAQEIRPKAEEQLRKVWHQEQQRRLLLILPPDRYDNVGKSPAPKNVAEWLAQQKAVARSFGGITAISDSENEVLATKLGPPDFLTDPSAIGSRQDATIQLLGSLSSSQWKEIASPQGLGVGSLSPQQRALWEGIVPNPFALDRNTSPENPRVISNSERQSIRLRVKLMSEAYARNASGVGTSFVILQNNKADRARNGEPFLTMHAVPAPPPVEAPETERTNISRRYGQVVSWNEPNRPRRLPADFEAQLSSAPVLISESEAKPLTAGGILDQVETVTGVHLFASAHYRQKAVLAVNTANVSAADLLHALLFITKQTVRIVPPAQSGEPSLYVVAAQNEPTGRIEGRWQDWNTAAENAQRGIKEDAIARIAEQDTLSLLQFGANDLLPLSEELKKRVFAAARLPITDTRDTREQYVSVPFGALPVSAQTAINVHAQSLTDASLKTGVDYRVRVDNVLVHCEPWLSYVVPGAGSMAGEIDVQQLGNITDWLPIVETESSGTLGKRTLILSADTAEEIQTLVTAARQASVKEIWVQTSPEIVSAAVEAAGNTPVRAVVSLLRAAKDTPSPLPRDENIHGKPERDWLLPDDPAVVAYTAQRVRAAAAIPGIAGIVLRDAVPPGYRGANEAASDEIFTVTGDFGDEYGESARTLGYTLAHRRAYIQQEGRDPADILASDPEESGTPMYNWRVWTRKLLLPLWREVRAAAGDKSLLMEGEEIFDSHRRFPLQTLQTYVAWDAASPEPPSAALFRRADSKEPTFAKTSLTLTAVVGNLTTIPPDELLKRMQRDDKPERTVWDLSNLSVPGVRERLRALKRGKKVP